MLKYILIIFVFSATIFAAKIDKNLHNFLEENPGENVKIWIFFKDKGPQENLSFSKEVNRISERAIKRRSKMSSKTIKFADYPVSDAYINLVKEQVHKIRYTSRWLNAVSADASPDKIELLQNLECVKEIRFLHTYKERVIKDNISSFNKSYSAWSDTLDYGSSQDQIIQIGVDHLHEKGFTGEGVVIAMLDDGFNQYDTHITFNSLDVLDTYDFVHGDKDVADRGDIPREGWHGTQVLSVIAGYTPGTLIGPAFSASYLLGKTELDGDEIQQEEDYWVAGLEWAEEKGADIVSSSVGYIDWYTWEDMDGQTAVTTLATIVAESMGLIVVNSAGNEGTSNDPNSIIAPSDGFFVIAAGGVDRFGNYYSRSSFGPTKDGRIKPDVCAMGTGVLRASDSNTESFSLGSGTSFSAPLTAGAIALLLEAFPELTPHKVREAIKKTASQAEAPDNFLGYGILDINAAYEFIKSDSLSGPGLPVNVQNSPNPFNIYTRIQYSVKAPSIVSITVYDILGREVIKFPDKAVDGNDYQIVLANQLGASGVYFYRIEGKESSSGKRIKKMGKLLFHK